MFFYRKAWVIILVFSLLCPIMFAAGDGNFDSRIRGKSAIECKHSWWHLSLMYFPNRVMDLSDIITLNGGVGPEASFELTFTKRAQFGGSYGDRYFIEKGFNRQFGGGYSDGYNGSFSCWNREEEIVDYIFGTVQPYVNLNKNKNPCPCREPYKSKIVDFWRIGVRTGWIVNVGVDIHPTAVANFFTGFCFLRVTKTDDL